MNKRDFIAIAIVLVASVAGFLFFNRVGETGSRIEVTRDGSLIGNYSLTENREIDLEGNTLVVEEGAVYMKSADCPDRYCVSKGKISRVGENIVCLPHKLVVEVKGGDDIDAVAR